MSNSVTFFVPYHTGYAHAELILSFSSFTDIHLFIYKWNPALKQIQDYFSRFKQIHLHEFNLDTILRKLNDEQNRRVVVLLTASTNYLFGQSQLRFFRLLQQHVPSIVDVYPFGHCMYGCESCTYAYSHRLPITFINYIRTRNVESEFNSKEILICPSYSFEGSPGSLLSNRMIVEKILNFSFPHTIKLHPVVFESNNGDSHPFLSLTDLEREHVDHLLTSSKNVLPPSQTNTLKLIQQARVLICDSNSSVPFEALYFNDKKYIFVYELAEDHDDQDDRQDYFHLFQSADQLTSLLERYFAGELDCRTEKSHEFFLEKYQEPTGNEIEELADVRQWLSDEHENVETIDCETIKDSIKKEFQSSCSPLMLYALGEHTHQEVLNVCFDDDSNLFSVLQENATDL